MKRMARMALCAALGLSLGACAAPDVTHYRQEQPVLDLVQYFSGTTEAWGMFQKRGGEVVKRFHVLIEGREANGKFFLDERFTYSDGSTQQRVWTLEKRADGRWRGTAADVVGEAEGEAAGNALHWRYTLRLPVDGKAYEVQMDDWMFLVDRQTLLNRTSMSKFNVELGQVTIFFRKRP